MRYTYYTKTQFSDIIYNKISSILNLYNSELEEEWKKQKLYLSGSVYASEILTAHIENLQHIKERLCDFRIDARDYFNGLYEAITEKAENDPQIIKNIKQTIQTKTVKENRFYKELVANIEKKAKETGNTEIVTMIENFNKVEL